MRFDLHSTSLISEFLVGLRPSDCPDLCSAHEDPYLIYFYSFSAVVSLAMPIA